MQTVLELGCGDEPGPFFEGATVHHAIDTDVMAVTEASRLRPDIRVDVMDATALEFPDMSVDVVLARNVLGDPMLGLDEHARNMSMMLMGSAIGNKLETFLEVSEGVCRAVNNYKVRIVHEVRRVLVAGGRLIVVEQYSPAIAQGFLDDNSDELAPLEFLPADIFAVAPRSYADYHTFLSKTLVWQAIKNS